MTGISPGTLPVGREMAFQRSSFNSIRIGSKAKRNWRNIRKGTFPFIFTKNLPRNAPAPVSSIQLVRTIPIISSLPLRTEKHSRIRNICVARAENPRVNKEILSECSNLIMKY
jgi:hypothetical protein